MNYSEMYNDSCVKRYFDSLSHISLLTAEEEVDLSQKKKKGDRKAGERLVESNLRLVIKIAKGYANSDVSFIDLIQEGNIGLIRAADKFDPAMGCRFSTYASYWIKHYITRFIAKTGRLIRIPIRKNDMIKKIRQERDQFVNEHGCEPTVGDLSLAVGIDEKTVTEMLGYIQPTVSLELPLLNDEASLHEIVSDTRTQSPDSLYMKTEMKHEITDALDSLMGSEKEILKMRYGFSGEGELTLKEAGKHFGISAETVRQIEMRAMNKIRQKYQHLSCYID
jgi:RNA polymerase primary sigma factor